MTLLDLLRLMRKHLKTMIALPVIFALVAAAYSWLLLPNVYTANVSMYVLTTTSSSAEEGISSSDLSASQMVTNDVATLIESDRVKQDTAEALQMPTLSDYEISVDSSTSTRVLTLSVTGESAQSVAIVANRLAQTTDEVAREVMGVEAVNVVDEAAEPASPSGPPRALYTAVAFLAGLFVAIVIIVIVDLTNTRVRSAEEAEELLGLPVIGRIPTIKG